MAVLEGGVSAALAGVAAESASGLHVDVRPTAYGALGHYMVAGATGTMAAGIGGNSQIFHIRYTGSGLLVVQDITLDQFRSLGTAFAAGEFIFALTRITAWTVDGSGGTAITPLKMRTSMSAANATVRISSTAALTAGTSTLDATNMREIRGIVGTAANQIQTAFFQTTATAVLGFGPVIPFLPLDISNGQHPLVLANQEGFAIRATVPGTGTWQAVLSCRFAEVSAF